MSPSFNRAERSNEDTSTNHSVTFRNSGSVCVPRSAKCIIANMMTEQRAESGSRISLSPGVSSSRNPAWSAGKVEFRRIRRRKNHMIVNMDSSSSHDRHHNYDQPHMSVIIVGLQNRCCESDTEFLRSLKQGGCLRSSRPRLRNLGSSRRVGAALYLGDLREKDFHFSSGHSGIRSFGSRRRADGYPGSGQATS